MSENVEVQNAKEEIKELLENCIYCGLCKSNCSVFRILREEGVSPRGKVLMLQNNVYDKIIYACDLCGNCEKKCPRNIKLIEAFRKARKVLVESKKETKGGKEMLRNFKKYGNIFGK